MTTVDRRTFMGVLPALAVAPPVFAQSPRTPPFRATGLSQMTLTVSDVSRSLDFYQGLFGMPVQARHGSTVLLRIGAGPKFLAIRPAAADERPSISGLGIAVQDFSVDRAIEALKAHGVTPAPPGAMKPGPKEALVRVRRTDEGGSPDGSTRDLFVGDPSGVVFQLHDASYCGGSGALGNACPTPAPSPRKGIMAVSDMSHFTIAASDPNTVPFYLELFGFTPIAYQAATPGWGVGGGVHFLMFIGGGGPTRGGAPGAPARGGGGGAAPAGRGARGGGRGGGAAAARIDHACMGMQGFDPAAVTKLLVGFGLTQQPGQSRTPLVTYISLRMPDRGGAEGGTPELYFTDPDGLAIQLQDVTYCGGGGRLGEICPPLPPI